MSNTLQPPIDGNGTEGEWSGTERRVPVPKIKYDPTITLGTLITLGTIAISLGIAYGAYKADQIVQDTRLTQLEKERIEDRSNVKESLSAIQKSSDTTVTNIQKLSESIAVINAKLGTRQAP